MDNTHKYTLQQEVNGTHVEGKTIAFEEHLQVGILHENGVVGHLVDAFLQAKATLLYERILEAAKRTFFGNWWNHDARVVERQCFVQPKKVRISS
jgi:hypothetical protein